ncbi:phosphonate metabolism protein PhnG [Alsobacter metallidurans]|uniref:Phosphonate metabolism protein PhnG n=1 Tax=Alsobacter metallidurans TaxID=340221 RepID=A0A917I6Y6_9HYPH|nr:phosphonate C-P lyase system protein PhnG [Alsobacter metallidurans]GGH16011.1 phosphonate metabolism protein PhnG [Alsobacter metallidurans]
MVMQLNARRTDDTVARQHLMATAAVATLDELEQAVARLGRPACQDLRAPEIGLVMLRGRMGGDGAPFNMGEATVTRAAVRLETGEVGMSYLLGRDPSRARLAAVIDAVWLRDSALVETVFLDPVQARMEADRREAAARSAATRVDFFTLVRGED